MGGRKTGGVCVSCREAPVSSGTQTREEGAEEMRRSPEKVGGSKVKG